MYLTDRIGLDMFSLQHSWVAKAWKVKGIFVNDEALGDLATFYGSQKQFYSWISLDHTHVLIYWSYY